MTSAQNPDTDYEGRCSDILNKTEEDLEDDSSSDISSSSSESEGALDEAPHSPQRDTGYSTPYLQDSDQQPAPNEKIAKLFRLYGERDVERVKWKHREAKRYRKMCRQARWEDCRYIRSDERESFEDAAFGHHYPNVAQLRIPAARRYAIMAAQETRSIEKELLQKSEHEGNFPPQNGSTTAHPSRPYLNLLPLEVQLQILNYCLTTSAPLIDFCFGYRFPASQISTDSTPGQDLISLAILSTNQHFRHLGLQILWQENTFLYTRSDEFTLLHTNLLMSRPQITLLRHITLHQDSIWPLQTFYDRVMLDSILFAVSVTELFPALRSLRLEFSIGEIYPYTYERGKWLRATLLEARYFLSDIRQGRRLRALQQFEMMGVSDDDLGCLAVKLASYLVGDEGRLGVQLAEVEKWSLWNEDVKVVPSEADMFSMERRDVDAWVGRQREMHRGQGRVFDLEFFPEG